jgi:ATP-dependent Lon protease
LQEIPDNVKTDLEIVPVRWIDKVLEIRFGIACRRHCLMDEPVVASTARARCLPIGMSSSKRLIEIN